MSILSLVPVFFILALLLPAAWALGKVYRRSRDPRTVICPENGNPATIRLDVRHAVAMHAIGEEKRRVRACSYWPERQGCRQECLR